MLEHQMKVIEGVSFDKRLFEKEINKSMSWLTPDEIDHLEIWLLKNFKKTHLGTIRKIFQPVAI